MLTSGESHLESYPAMPGCSTQYIQSMLQQSLPSNAPCASTSASTYLGSPTPPPSQTSSHAPQTLDCPSPQSLSDGVGSPQSTETCYTSSVAGSPEADFTDKVLLDVCPVMSWSELTEGFLQEVGDSPHINPVQAVLSAAASIANAELQSPVAHLNARAACSTADLFGMAASSAPLHTTSSLPVETIQELTHYHHYQQPQQHQPQQPQQHYPLHHPAMPASNATELPLHPANTTASPHNQHLWSAPQQLTVHSQMMRGQVSSFPGPDVLQVDSSRRQCHPSRSSVGDIFSPCSEISSPAFSMPSPLADSVFSNNSASPQLSTHYMSEGVCNGLHTLPVQSFSHPSETTSSCASPDPSHSGHFSAGASTLSLRHPPAMTSSGSTSDSNLSTLQDCSRQLQEAQHAEQFADATQVLSPRKERKVKRRKPPKPAVLRKQIVNPKQKGSIPASIQLWEFILYHLERGLAKDAIAWIDARAGTFRIVSSERIANMWGQYRSCPSMDYEKMTRALRYYYNRHILAKLQRRLIYQFTPELMRQVISHRSS